MISTTCDAEADALYLRIAPRDATVADTQEIEPAVILDKDASGHVIGIEILGVRGRSAETAVAA